MGIVLNANVTAMQAYDALSTNQMNESTALQQLSTGYSINKASDNAAGLVISEELRAQIGGYQQATANSQQAINLVQTAEGALNETESILQRMRTLAVQGSNGTADSTALGAITAETTQNLAQIDQINNSTVYGSLNLFGTGGATTSASFTFQVGQNANAVNSIVVSISAATTVALGLSGLNVSSNTFASAAIATIDAAISYVSALRGNLGAYQNRLSHVINNDQVATQNITASEAGIRDTDMAATMSTFTRNQILTQASTSMLAQANSMPQSVLKLLG